MYKKILVIKLRHIGDVLLATPVFCALKEHFPNSQIFALVNKGTEAVLEQNPFIDQIITFDRSIKKLPFPIRFKQELQFLSKLRSNGFDTTIDLTGGDRAALFSFISGAKIRVGFSTKGFLGKKYLYTHRAKPNWELHTVLMNLELLKLLGIEIENPKVRIFLTEEETRWAEDLVCSFFGDVKGKEDKLLIHVHPTSRWLFKCWKDEYMAEVIKWFVLQGKRVIITSSDEKKELEKVKRILSFLPSDIILEPDSIEYKSNQSIQTDKSPKILNLSGKLTLRQLIALSSKSDLFFGVDSAPMHIAAALGKPVVALFGPSRAINWGPWDNQASGEPYKRKSGVQKFGRNLVIQRDWSCIPCGRDGCGGSKISKCLFDIEPDEVKNILKNYVI